MPIMSLLTILFIALNLTGYITWSWLWVLAPFWGTIVAVGLFYATLAAIAIFSDLKNV